MSKRLLITIILIAAPALAHMPEGGPERAIIVDTDMALDDIRAIVLLCQVEDVNLLAALTSDGASSPETGAVNLRRILRRMGMGAVPVAAGPALAADPPPWRPLAESLGWSGIADESESPPSTPPETAVGLLRDVLSEEHDVLYLCLGPLTNLSALLARHSHLAERIRAVQYYGSPPGVPEPSWNTVRDRASAERVFAADLSIRSLQFRDDQLLRYDEGLSSAICGLEGKGPELLCALHGSDRIHPLIEDGHFRCWDETAVLDLLFPELVSWQPAGEGGGLEMHFDLLRGRERYLNLLSGDLSMKHGHRHPVTLRAFPDRPEELRADVAAIAEEAQSRHGREEWNSVLLANELHRHLGIYSILGAKMGIRARELLDAGLDELTVLSYAGDAPPLSCMTDGLQVATGATLGRGTISVAPGERRPAARFAKGDRTVELCVKEEIVERARGDIVECTSASDYWAAVRALALRYWLEIDRREAFVERK